MKHLNRLALFVLLVAATWACVQIGQAFQAVRTAADRTGRAMEGTVQYQAVEWRPEPPESPEKKE